MGSLPDSPTMGFLGYLSLVALLSCGIQGASLPYQNGYQFHLNQKGVRMDLEMKDVNPLVGGKVHVELPISPVWKILEVDAQLLKPIIIALEKNTLGRIYDVMTVKADITFNAEEILKGIFNVALDYTLVHKDGTEEKATLLIQGKNESGKLVASMEIIPKNNVVIPEKKIFFPLEMIFTCNWPSAHTLTIKGDFGKIFLNIANDMNEVSVRGVLEYLGQQYKYSTILSIREKMFTVTLQGPSKELYNIVMKVKMLNGFPILEITGNIPTFQYFTAGDFKTVVIVKGWLNYEIKHTFHGMEMMRLTFGMLNGFPRMEITGNVPAFKYLTAGTFKTEVIVISWFNYEIKHAFNGVEMLKLTFSMLNGFPRIEITGKTPTFEYFTAGTFKTEVIAHSWLNYEIKQASNGLEILKLTFGMLNGFPRIEITGYVPAFQYFTAGDFKTEVIVNSWLNYEIKHIFNDVEMMRLTFEMLNGFPMIMITGTVPTTPLFTAGDFKSELRMKSLYNYEIKHVFKGMEMLNLNIALINGKMEMMMKYGQTHKTHIVLEYKYLRWIKILLPTTNTWLSKDLGVEIHYQPTNEAKLLEGGNIKIVAKSDKMPFMKFGGYYGLTLDSTKYEILLNDFYVNLLNNEIMLFDGITFSELKFYGKITLDNLSMNVMDYLNLNALIPKIALEAKIHKDEQKVFHYILTTIETPYKLHIFFPYLFQNILSMPQEHIEITHEHVVLGNKQVISTLCNLTTKKIITTVTPTMMSFELFDGEVSLVKYVTELTKIDVGRNSMLLEGNKIVQFNAYQPWFLPAILDFNQLKTKFHLEVVDKAEGKMNINVAVIKDTTELINAVVNNVEVPYMIVLKAPVLPLEMRIDHELSTKVWSFKINNRSYLEVRPTVPYMMVVKAPVLPLEMRIDFELPTQVWNVKIKNRSYLELRPTVANEVEAVLTGFPLFRVALLAKELRITTIMKDLPEITTAVTLKTFSLFQNTLGIEVMVGKISHKTLLGWNINMLRKAFVDVKVIGSGTELLGDYEVIRHLNWNIVNLKNIDVEWTGKVLCTGLKFFKTPMVTEGKLLFKDFVVDMKMVEKLMDVPYTLIFKSHPLTVALLPFFQYP